MYNKVIAQFLEKSIKKLGKCTKNIVLSLLKNIITKKKLFKSKNNKYEYTYSIKCFDKLQK